MQTLDLEQGSPEWFEARCGIPTASEFSRFITPARGDYSKQSIGYIADLIVESVEGPPDNISSYWMDRGVELESEARSFYEFETEIETETAGIILNKGAGWSPDALIGEMPNGLEIKCPKPSTHVKWLFDGKLPQEHAPQVHGALVIAGCEWIDFLSYCPGYKPLLIRVMPSEYTNKVSDALDRFLIELEAAKIKVLA